jgi:hypothetical protein
MYARERERERERKREGERGATLTTFLTRYFVIAFSICRVFCYKGRKWRVLCQVNQKILRGRAATMEGANLIKLTCEWNVEKNYMQLNLWSVFQILFVYVLYVCMYVVSQECSRLRTYAAHRIWQLKFVWQTSFLSIVTRLLVKKATLSH